MKKIHFTPLATVLTGLIFLDNTNTPAGFSISGFAEERGRKEGEKMVTKNKTD